MHRLPARAECSGDQYTSGSRQQGYEEAVHAEVCLPEQVRELNARLIFFGRLSMQDKHTRLSCFRLRNDCPLRQQMMVTNALQTSLRLSSLQYKYHKIKVDRGNL
eukprot:3358630-Amphidinium_carterae.1